MADLGLVGRGTHHRHGTRREHVGDAAGLGALLPGVLHLARPRRRRDVELQVQRRALQRPADLEARVTEHAHHLVVLGEDLGDETRQPALARGRGEVLEQDRPETAALVVVAHDERDLGRGGLREPDVAPDGDDLAAEPEHEGDSVVVVDLHEVLEVALGDVRIGAEVPEVARPVRQLGVERHHRVGVVRRDRAQVRGRAVGRDDVGLPGRGVGRVGHRPDLCGLGVGVRRLGHPGPRRGVSRGCPPGPGRAGGTRRGGSRAGRGRPRPR